MPKRKFTPRDPRHLNARAAANDYYSQNKSNLKFAGKFTRAHPLLLEGKEIQQIARTAGTNRDAIRRYAKFLGVPLKVGPRMRRHTRVEQQDRTLIDAYLRFRETHTQEEAARRTGITKKAALRIERENLGESTRKSHISRSKSGNRGDPRVDEMRFLLRIKDQDGFFRFPIKTLRKVFDVWQSPIDRANMKGGTIRGKAESLSSARRFRHYSPERLAELETEARRLLSEYRRTNTERIERTAKEKKFRTLTTAERKKLEAILLSERVLKLPRREETEHGPTDEQVNWPERIAFRRKIMRTLLSAPEDTMEVKELERQLNHKWFKRELNELSTGKGIGLIIRKNGTVAINPEVVAYLDISTFRPR